MRTVAVIFALLTAADAGAGTVCRFPDSGPPESGPPESGPMRSQAALPAGHSAALMQLCDALRGILDQRPDLLAQGEVQVQLMQADGAGMTLRLALRQDGHVIAGQPLEITTIDSTQFSPAALHRLAGLLVQRGPFRGPIPD